MIIKIINLFFYVIAAFYIFLMIDLLFRFNVMFDAHRIVSRSFNLIPFKTIWDYANGNNHVSKSFIADNILGNMVVFIPYGLYLQVIQKRKAFAKSLLIVIITSIAIEMIQFVFGLGASDIDDVILNCCGGIIIYLYFITVFNHLRL
jgi:glycopeptide antibiotics resistance protein